MRSNRIIITSIITSLIIIFSWLTCINVYAQSSATQGDPVVLLQYIANNMISGLKANKADLKTKPHVVYHLAHKYVVPYADLDQMSKRVLPPHTWNSATPSQRSQFKKEFTTTLIRTYASAFSSYQDQVVSFSPVRGGVQGQNIVEVNSEITGSQGEPIHVSYQMVKNGNVWRLIDLSVEGVDMLEGFRAQFADILSSGDMAELLKRMSQHNTRR